MKTKPRKMLYQNGNRVCSSSDRMISGMTPSSGPHSRCKPPRNAMTTTTNDTSGLKARFGLMKPKRGAISAPVSEMNIADTMKIVTLASGTLTPT